MLSQEMTDKLNDQITLEFYSSNFYLQMSSWSHANRLEGAGTFLLRHSQEEMSHMFRLFNYVNDTGGQAIIGPIEQPQYQFSSIKEVFEKILVHERLVTSKINDIVGTAFKNQDFSSFNFLQWYVAEQHEEERLFAGIVDKIDLIGLEGRGLFLIDQEIGRLTGTMTTPNPVEDAKVEA